MRLPASLDEMATRKEIILFILILVLGAVAFLRTVYLVEIGRNQELKIQVKNLTMQKEAMEQFQQTVLAKQGEQQKVQQTQRSNLRLKILLGERVPAARDLTGLVGQITEESFTRGIRIESIEYQPVKSEQGLGHTTIMMKAYGRYQDIVAYLGRLERLAVLLDLGNVTLGQSGEGNSELSFAWQADYYEIGG